jgi:hypothetical protein
MSPLSGVNTTNIPDSSPIVMIASLHLHTCLLTTHHFVFTSREYLLETFLTALQGVVAQVVMEGVAQPIDCLAKRH